MSGIVLDASVALAWCFPDEVSEYADRVLLQAQGTNLYVPAIWAIEIANALWIGERRGRIHSPEIRRFADLLMDLNIVEDLQRLPVAVANILPLAREHNISAYDAAYLDLAIRRRWPLATLDTAQQAAAHAAGIDVLKV